MKSTGMVRRIDDLGRIVIPKEVRRTLRISKGDPLELYIDSNGNIVFKKYSLMGEISKLVSCLCDSLNKVTDLPVLVCNKEKVICARGLPRKESEGRRICEFAVDSMSLNKIFLAEEEQDSILPIEELDLEAFAVVPIGVREELVGYLIVLKDSNKKKLPSELIKKILTFVSNFLCSFLE